MTWKIGREPQRERTTKTAGGAGASRREISRDTRSRGHGRRVAFDCEEGLLATRGSVSEEGTRSARGSRRVPLERDVQAAGRVPDQARREFDRAKWSGLEPRTTFHELQDVATTSEAVRPATAVSILLSTRRLDDVLLENVCARHLTRARSYSGAPRRYLRGAVPPAEPSGGTLDQDEQ